MEDFESAPGPAEKHAVTFPLLEGQRVADSIEQMTKSPAWGRLEPNFLRADVASINNLSLGKIIKIYDTFNHSSSGLLERGEFEIDGIKIKPLGEGQSSRVYAVHTDEGMLAVKIGEMSSPRPPLIYTDKNIFPVGSTMNGEYVTYSDLRYFMTLPGEGREITFMEYGGAETLEGKSQYKPLIALKSREILSEMEKAGFVKLPSKGTTTEIGLGHNYLKVDGGSRVNPKIAAIDIPFWRPNKDYLNIRAPREYLKEIGYDK